VVLKEARMLHVRDEENDHTYFCHSFQAIPLPPPGKSEKEPPYSIFLAKYRDKVTGEIEFTECHWESREEMIRFTKFDLDDIVEFREVL